MLVHNPVAADCLPHIHAANLLLQAHFKGALFIVTLKDGSTAPINEYYGQQ